MQNPDDLGCIFMDQMLSRLDLPERWSAIIPNTDGVLRDVVVEPPCPELEGATMNGLRQQQLSRIVIGAFFDMHLRSGVRAEQADQFFTGSLIAENSDVSLTLPR